MSAEEEVERVYREFWADIVQRPDGVIDIEQVKRELYDYHTCITEVPKVYVHVTGGLLSKPNYLASVVTSAADEYTERLVDQALGDHDVVRAARSWLEWRRSQQATHPWHTPESDLRIAIDELGAAAAPPTEEEAP